MAALIALAVARRRLLHAGTDSGYACVGTRASALLFAASRWWQERAQAMRMREGHGGWEVGIKGWRRVHPAKAAGASSTSHLVTGHG